MLTLVMHGGFIGAADTRALSCPLLSFTYIPDVRPEPVLANYRSLSDLTKRPFGFCRHPCESDSGPQVGANANIHYCIMLLL
eukprot:COSAG06_NODE_6503_length_2904_cov_2.120143_1_plen_81_part_10